MQLESVRDLDLPAVGFIDGTYHTASGHTCLERALSRTYRADRGLHAGREEQQRQCEQHCGESGRSSASSCLHCDLLSAEGLVTILVMARLCLHTTARCPEHPA